MAGAGPKQDFPALWGSQGPLSLSSGSRTGLFSPSFSRQAVYAVLPWGYSQVRARKPRNAPPFWVTLQTWLPSLGPCQTPPLGALRHLGVLAVVSEERGAVGGPCHAGQQRESPPPRPVYEKGDAAGLRCRNARPAAVCSKAGGGEERGGYSLAGR